MSDSEEDDEDLVCDYTDSEEGVCEVGGEVCEGSVWGACEFVE